MSQSERLATATLEKWETGLGTSPSVVRHIPMRVSSISSLYGAKTNLKTISVCTLNNKVPHNKRPYRVNSLCSFPSWFQKKRVCCCTYVKAVLRAYWFFYNYIIRFPDCHFPINAYFVVLLPVQTSSAPCSWLYPCGRPQNHLPRFWPVIPIVI